MVQSQRRKAAMHQDELRRTRTSCVAPLSVRVNVTSTNVTSPGWKFAPRHSNARRRGGSQTVIVPA
jgi:hypothetical protein